MKPINNPLYTVLCGMTFTIAPLHRGRTDCDHRVYLCLSVCPSALKITHERGDGCRQNLIDKGKEWPSRCVWILVLSWFQDHFSTFLIALRDRAFYVLRTGCWNTWRHAGVCLPCRQINLICFMGHVSLNANPRPTWVIWLLLPMTMTHDAWPTDPVAVFGLIEQMFL